jgi:hypothetical protein
VTFAEGFGFFRSKAIRDAGFGSAARKSPALAGLSKGFNDDSEP